MPDTPESSPVLAMHLGDQEIVLTPFGSAIACQLDDGQPVVLQNLN